MGRSELVESGRRTILVEGVSDQAALEMLARRRKLQPPRVIVLGGAHAVRNHVKQAEPGTELVGLCDAKEAPLFRRVLTEVHVCEPDLEGELVRAVGVERVVQLIEAEGELDSFRILQRQPAHRSNPMSIQLARFLSGRSGNKERYARLFVEALELDRVPPPLDAVLGGP